MVLYMYSNWIFVQNYSPILLPTVLSQNIDTLERLAGVPAKSLVEAHGSFAKAWCTNGSCRKEYDAHEVCSLGCVCE